MSNERTPWQKTVGRKRIVIRNLPGTGPQVYLCGEPDNAFEYPKSTVHIATSPAGCDAIAEALKEAADQLRGMRS